MSARPRFTSTEPARDPADEAAASAAARRLAVRVVAARSTGVEDCRDLLDMLGLHSAAGLPGPAIGDLTQFEPPIPGRR
ncbi:hypothetical protein [Actinomycetospora sp. NBRC 106378]|uniref:hypothetical protein n=1 Tax=Actinomycetospora sp. NBRC 106378 TaxID=3032208 RepID=UPI0024A08D19|nr:hypothetical protein [Actinomycetospora sp. NBRC 106378]GLZ55959.1 hypothetical protein Acsp07_55760 [Actinomycetospora sp. NBRC 106378]